jgi:hypothetical protein
MNSLYQIIESRYKEYESYYHAFDLSATIFPDLNPIEFIWKSIKRELSSMFLMHKEEVK